MCLEHYVYQPFYFWSIWGHFADYLKEDFVSDTVESLLKKYGEIGDEEE